MRVALITGGASGIGLATARRFATDGMRVVVADLDPQAAGDVAGQLAGSGHLGIRIDVSDEGAVEGAFETIEASVGPVDVLANFAGVLRTATGPSALQDLTLEEWDSMSAVNSRGSFLCVREMARRRSVRPVEHGRIILVSSAGAQLGGYQVTLAYIASKGAVLALAKGAARELAPLGITVNVIAPGPIDTPMLRAATAASGGSGDRYTAMDRVPLGRVGLPEEVAAAAAYLASESAAFTTGSTLDVNGGVRMQ